MKKYNKNVKNNVKINKNNNRNCKNHVKTVKNGYKISKIITKKILTKMTKI